MTFQPVVPFGGVAGWSFLQRTKESQQQAFNESPRIQRDADYFRDNISNVLTAEDLVSDRRLLSVALGAFGLDDDINNTFFVKKILSDGVLNEDALANKLTDKRYYAFSQAFGFGDFSVPNTQLSDFPDKIVPAFQDKQFQVGIGEQNEGLRLALSVDEGMSDILSRSSTDDGYWFAVMGNPPLRRVFETALGVPSAVASLDLDRQLDEFRSRASRALGDGEVSQFADAEKQEWLIRRFLVRAETETGISPLTSGSAAVTLLQLGGVQPSLL